MNLESVEFVGPKVLWKPEGSSGTGRDGETRAAPPGSETAARSAGLPRNLGGPVVSVEERGGRRDTKTRPPDADSASGWSEHGEQAVPATEENEGAGKNGRKSECLSRSDEVGEPTQGTRRSKGRHQETEKRWKERSWGHQAPVRSHRNSNV
jgi:hypothetical protein